MQTVDVTEQAERRRGVLFLLNSLAVGGSERKSVTLANSLRARGWNVHLAHLNSLTRSSRPLLTLVDEKVPVQCLGRHGLYSLSALYRLSLYLKRNRINQVVCVNLHPLLYALPIATITGREQLRVIALVNTTFSSKGEGRFMRLYGRLLKQVDQIVFGCQSQMESWINAYSLNPSGATCIYNGIDLKRFDVSPPDTMNFPGHLETRTPGNVTIGSVARLRPEKNLPELLLAAEQLIRRGTSISVLIVGDGSERSMLEQFTRDRGIREHVIFHGQADDVRPLLSAMDIFVLTSSTIETFSNAALEAMAMGRPVILSRVGGAAEMVTPGHNGYLYESGRPEELADLLELLIRDAAERRRMGALARQVMERRFGLDRMIDQYEAALSDSRLMHAVR